MYVSIICIPQLFSEGSYIYPYNDEPIMTKIINELNNYWNKIINLSLVDYPLIGIYFRIYHDVKLNYMKLNNSSALTSSLLISNSTMKNFNNIIQSSLSASSSSSSLSHLPSSFLPASQPSSSSSSSSSQESIRLYQVFFNFYLYWPNENLFIFATFILSCSIWIATGSLLLFHIYLIFIGKTTIEYINSIHSSTSSSSSNSSKSYSSNIRAVGNGYLDGCFCRIFDTSSSNSNSSINHHHHHRHNHHRSHHRHIHRSQQRTSYRKMKDNFIQIFGNAPLYLTFLPSIRQPPIIDSVMITTNKKNDDDDDDDDDDENNNNEFIL
jgi:hypothetical protein